MITQGVYWQQTCTPKSALRIRCIILTFFFTLYLQYPILFLLKSGYLIIITFLSQEGTLIRCNLLLFFLFLVLRYCFSEFFLGNSQVFSNLGVVLNLRDRLVRSDLMLLSLVILDSIYVISYPLVDKAQYFGINNILDTCRQIIYNLVSQLLI